MFDYSKQKNNLNDQSVKKVFRKIDVNNNNRISK